MINFKEFFIKEATAAPFPVAPKINITGKRRQPLANNSVIPVTKLPAGAKIPNAFYIGTQEGFAPANIPDMDLFNMLEPLYINGEEYANFDSTVSRQALEKAGFFVPPIPSGTPKGTRISDLIQK